MSPNLRSSSRNHNTRLQDLKVINRHPAPKPSSIAKLPSGNPQSKDNSPPNSVMLVRYLFLRIIFFGTRQWRFLHLFQKHIQRQQRTIPGLYNVRDVVRNFVTLPRKPARFLFRPICSYLLHLKQPLHLHLCLLLSVVFERSNYLLLLLTQRLQLVFSYELKIISFSFPTLDHAVKNLCHSHNHFCRRSYYKTHLHQL